MLISCRNLAGLWLLINVIGSGYSQLPACAPEDLKYTFTECDDNGNRWWVQVPIKPQSCELASPEAPQHGMKCGFSCKSGHFLNLQSQQCEACPPGTYSLGSGVRFDVWNTMPEGFERYAESVTFSQYGYMTKVNNCTRSVWKTTGQYLVSNDDDCTSSLSYAVNLKQDGFVNFKYQHSDSDMMFHFYIQNGQCQTSHDKKKNTFLNITGTEWKSWKVMLSAGQNVLYWKTTGILVGEKRSINPVKIKDIEISGVSYTTKCHECRPGFFAPSNASHWCDLCPSNTMSLGGATSCTPCDVSTEYAAQGASECLNRPPCMEKDYFATHSKCSKNKTTKILYKWVEPKVCLDSLETSVKLPDSNHEKPCAPCNPGFSYTAKGCVACQKNSYSNGSSECKSCPANTAPHYGFWYSWWDSLPSNMKTSCISFDNRQCNVKKGWIPVGDQVRTVSSKSDDAYLILVLHLNGFFESYSENIVGKVTFIFSLDCLGECQFYFMKDNTIDGTTVVESWRGKQERKTYTYVNKYHKGPMSFTWAFQRSKLGTDDMASLFVVNVTNALGGSADTCQSCVGQARNEKCIPCPMGSYADITTRQCLECPTNTRLNIDRTGCVTCGKNTQSREDKEKCLNNCTYISTHNNRKYDFMNLSSTFLVETKPSFTNTGRKYNHVYQLNICMNEGVGFAKCVDNVTMTTREGSTSTVQGMICRSTATNMIDQQGKHVTVHSQPTIVADSLVEVYQVDNETSLSSPFENEDDAVIKDVVYHMRHYESDSKECTDGRHSYVYLRCDPLKNLPAGQIEMPQNCPDGTCDGCNFHFLWKSFDACPLCTENDYEAVVGSCIQGEQVTKYHWKFYPKNCKNGVSLPAQSSVPCRDFTIYIEVGSFLCVLLLLILIATTCQFWKKSKKLEYKYHRLVINSKGGNNDGELPAADSCALSDSDSDYDGQSDEVIFQKKKSRILGKKNANYESVHLQPMTSGV
uniref:UPF0577 protein KIAA1324-like n=1 Tax=Phallusia mammillata TaxID=59560 RepID=A0A6F9DFS5_9ASCI|nr:UPF0577 protein KIAA1324-like [Phallusia mammillata]